jgi:hypothetical protein
VLIAGETEWLEVLKSFGFPVVVALYLLIRTDSRLGELAKAISELSRVIDRYISKGV